MADLELPAYRPVYPITKNVRPRQSQSRLPSSWGIEQRKTVGQNQTAPEWNVKWILEDPDANILDAFLHERATRNESFLWSPPGYPQARYRCDDWTKTIFDLNVSDIQATFKRIYDYDNLVTVKLENDHYSIDIQSIKTIYGYFVAPATGAFVFNTSLSVSLGRIYVRPFDTITVAVNVSDANFQKSLASDYFGGFHSQVYGWDRDFQVDWWAD